MKRLAISLSMFLLSLGAGTAHAALITYSAPLTGPSEVPPNSSPGTGSAMVVIDDVANTMQVDVSFSGLLSPTTIAHIHCCTTEPLTGTAGAATTVPSFPAFPAGVLAGTYMRTFNLLSADSYNPAFITNNGGTAASARDALLAGLAAGRSYLNIHSELFPGGEIRGFLVPAPAEVPEPGSIALFALGAAGMTLLQRRRAATRR